MKNVIIMHLESLNIYTLNNRKEYMPYLNSIKDQCISFSNYYSTATSTLMVIADLFGMDIHYTDNITSIGNLLSSEYEHKMLWDVLRDNGYACDNIYYRLNEDEHNNFIKLDKVFNSNYDVNFCEEIDILSEKIDKIMQNKNFALFLFDGKSHMDCLEKSDYLQDNHMEMVYGKRFSYLDDTVRWLFEKLEKTDHLKDTIVVLYGDHGDYYYNSGLREGYTHASEPNEQLIHCPLFVFDEGKCINEDRIIATSDIGNFILSQMGMKKYLWKKKYVVSRNIFPAQKRRADMLNKSFSICDGEWMMVVGRNGISLYNTKLDPYCTKNLLDYYLIKRGQLIYNEKYDSVLSTHYRGFMTNTMKEEILNKEKELYRELMVYFDSIDNIACKPKLNKINYTESLYYRVKLKLRINVIEHYCMSIKEKLIKK